MAVTAIAILLLGVAWRFAGWILEWIGRLLGVRGLTSSYEAFVEGYVGMLMTEGSLAKILGPWLLMGVGLIPSCRTLFAGPQRVGGRESRKCQTYLVVRVDVKKIAQA